jgi:hypothetical protein
MHSSDLPKDYYLPRLTSSFRHDSYLLKKKEKMAFRVLNTRPRRTEMTSKTQQIKMIRKHKKRAHKANRKADLKRMTENHKVLFPDAG